jgi:hypothetical protein
MPNTRRTTLSRGLGLLLGLWALALVAALCNGFPQSRTKVETLPGLENYQTESWLGNEALLVTPIKGAQPRALLRYDLRTHAIRPLPSPQRVTTNSRFLVSPDGHWILYRDTQSKETKGPYAVRWRVERVDRPEKRLFPANGSFRALPSEVEFPNPIACWLPDSRGWLGSSTATKKQLTLEKFVLTAASLQSETLTMPSSPFPAHPLPCAVTPDGELVFVDYDNHVLALHNLRSGARHKIALTVPHGEVDDSITDGRQILATVDTPKTGPSAWMAALLRRSPVDTDLWRFSFTGQPPVLLGRIPDSISGLTLLYEISPNGKHVLLRGDQDALLTIDETERRALSTKILIHNWN